MLERTFVDIRASPALSNFMSLIGRLGGCRGSTIRCDRPQGKGRGVFLELASDAMTKFEGALGEDSILGIRVGAQATPGSSAMGRPTSNDSFS